MAQTNSARSVREQQPYNGLFLVKQQEQPQRSAITVTHIGPTRRGRSTAGESETNLLILAAGTLMLAGAWAAEKLLQLLLHRA